MGVRMVGGVLVLVLGLGAVSGCAGHPAEAQKPRQPAQARPVGRAPVVETGALAPELLRAMSLREKVGQLFMPTVADAADGIALQRDYHVGGFIYLPGNLRTVERTAALTTALQSAARIPLLIGVEEETGLVSRARFTTRFPGAMALGATRSETLTREAAAITGGELKAAGINLNFAPVADVSADPANPVIGTRAFGSDPALVSALVRPAIEGFRSAGIATVAKHFPGHGDTATDGRTRLPVIRHTLAQWERLDAPPFLAAIAAGVDAIMTGRLKAPGLDPSGVPATLSEKVLTGLLRGRLGYDGVIVTDSLGVAGARVKGGAPEAAVRSVLAGADLVIRPPDLDTVYTAVLAAARSGRIPAARLDDAVRHVLTMKEQRGLFDAAARDAAVTTNAPGQTALEVATRAVTVVRNARRALPLTGGVHVAGADSARVEAALRREGVRIVAPGAARTFVVVFTAAGPGTPRYLTGLARQRKIVAVVLGSPYQLRHTRPAHASVAVYSAEPVALRGLARVLSGRADPTGRLPVDVPHGPAFGTGVTAF